MKNLKKVLALVLAVAIMMSIVVTASAKDYSDVKDDTNYADAIDALSGLGILDGFTDGSFQPEGTLTRAQAAKIVAIVHNAATNKKIQSDIADLYKNAQNSFVDCNGSWALPYINYCRITGLADGMTATTYEPNRVLTGVQFLKLMLTTLGFDTAKEGYTGTGWDINVLNRANEIGLTAGLADGWQGIKELKRGEAAQILYNALTKYIVEYGQLIKVDSVKGTFKNAFVSNEHVAQSGYTLGAKMGIKIVRATDAYRRPGYTWSYGTWTAFYMDAPVATYTNAVSKCDVLKAMGVGESNGTTVVTLAPKAENFNNDVAELNYYACDGYKESAVTLQHKKDKSCQEVVAPTDMDEHLFGGQGDLTQVFKTADGFVVTTVHTFLGEVTKVDKSNKYTHAGTASATLKIWYKMTNDEPTYTEKDALVNMSTSTTAYAVGTKVLTTISLKATDGSNIGRFQDGNVVEVVAAESKTGKLTGASDLYMTETVSIDGTKYFTNCRFVLGKDKAMKYANRNTTYTFYFDTHGNVIGCDNDTTAASYVVLTKIWATHEDGDYVLKANLVDLDGKAIEKVTVSNKAGSFKNATKGTTTAGDAYNGIIDDIAANNDRKLVNGLYSYTVDAKGVYTLNWVGYEASYGGYGRVAGSINHVAKLAYLSGTRYNDNDEVTAAGSHDVKISVSEATKFVVKSVGGEWTTYTGYTALPALTATYLDYVDLDGDGFEDIVYLGNATFAGDAITGWVTNWGPFDWAGEYDLVTVYVKGEPVVVNVKHAPDVEQAVGYYTFKMGTDADGVAYATAYAINPQISGEVTVVSKGISSDVTAIKVNNAGIEETIGLTGVAIYEVKADGTVVAADGNAIVEGDKVVYFAAGNKGAAPYAELYILDKTIPYNF